MSSPEFKKSVADAISAAAQQANQKEKAQEAATRDARDEHRRAEDGLANAKRIADRLKMKHLEPLCKEIRDQSRAQGYSFTGDFVRDPGSSAGGVVGCRLVAADDAEIEASIRYDHESLNLEVIAPPDCRHGLALSVDDFDEAAAVQFFESHLPAATGALIASGAFANSPRVKYGPDQ